MDVDGRLKQKVAVQRDEETSGMSLSALAKVGPAMAVVAIGIVLAYVVPGLEAMQPWKPGDPVPFWNVVGRPFESEAFAQQIERTNEIDSFADEVLSEPDPPPVPVAPKKVVVQKPGDGLPAYTPKEGDDKPAVQSIELFKGQELDRFFASLARSDSSLEGAITRVSHWGDSAIGIDGIPGAIRRRMQARFGDAGHGFHLMAPPNSSYRHGEVKLKTSGWSHCFIIFRCRKSSGLYGMGGTVFTSAGGGTSTFSMHPTRSSGQVSKFEVWYAEHPRGGQFSVRVDKGEKTFVNTRAEAYEERWHAVDVEDGPHTFEVRAAGKGKVELFGVTLERDNPGVVWDGLSQVGAFTNRMSGFDPDHLKDHLQHRKSDLAVFTFGGNDMIRKVTMEQYAAEYREVIQLFRKARPEMDCLIMAPLDHGERKGVRIVSQPIVPLMIEAQRQVAKSEGCGFFDTVAAMGGEGSAGRWFKRKPRLIGGDLSHATSKGHQVIGELVYRAIVEGYVAYRKRTK